MNDNVVLSRQRRLRPGSHPRPGSRRQLHRRSQESRQHAGHRRRRTGDAESPHRRNGPQYRQAVRRQCQRRANVAGVPIAAGHVQSLRPSGPCPQRCFGRPGRLGLRRRLLPYRQQSARRPATARSTPSPTACPPSPPPPTAPPPAFAQQCPGRPNALEQVGLVHLLAEPNLTAVSGETAKFLAGGEFPVPVAKDNQGNVTVDFKTFGVGLSFTPVVLSPSRISLQISTEDQRTHQHRRLYAFRAAPPWSTASPPPRPA